MLQVKNIKKSYTTGDFTQAALNDVSLGFRKNEFVAVLGASGSGKTTFLNIVGGLDRYDSGNLIINGKSTKTFKDKQWDAYRNNSVGFIFQSYNLITHLSVLGNVEMGMTLSGVSSKEKHRMAKEALERVGLKDHINKKPNQLSGGQMQRVAIARALANNPDIILADEPTGALDTETSTQIMDLIKEIARDKLVIMVTHNPDLAKEYADRIVEFQDGKVKSDSNPFDGESEDTDYKLKKTSMSFFTALKLSSTNILTKKGRTALTAFASSIGIIGIALILSLSNGFQKQIDIFEEDTLAEYPVMVSQMGASLDMDTMQQMGMETEVDKRGEFPSSNVAYPYDSQANSVMHVNNITDEYAKYIDKIDSKYVSGISYTRSVSMPLLHKDGDDVNLVSTSELMFGAYPEIADKTQENFIDKNVDVLVGKICEKETEIGLLVDKYNNVETSILKQLGIDTDKDEVNFDEIMGQELKVVMNDDLYEENNGFYIAKGKKEDLKKLYDNENNITLKVVGIYRMKESSAMQTTSGISYSDSLAKRFIENAEDSKVVKAQEDADYSVLTGQAFAEEGESSGSMMSMMSGGTGIATKSQTMAALGAVSTPSYIEIYPRDFESKEEVIKYLDDWNKDKDDEDKIVYTDPAEMIVSLSGGIMDGITLVLVAFAAVSLVVSLIMISIIIYISVLERRKEIGILRALGARKKDVSRVFNAETFIIGLLSGLMGIGIAYLLTIPANSIIESATGLQNVAQLNPVHAIVLVLISLLLTMLGGAIPAKMASKKDPVEALRSE